MNNEPVAIVNTNCENNIQWNVLKPQSYNGYFLYTHPAKTLTDEEIYKIAWHFEEEIEEYASGKWAIPKQDFVEFAKAILRKAQEK